MTRKRPSKRCRALWRVHGEGQGRSESRRAAQSEVLSLVLEGRVSNFPATLGPTSGYGYASASLTRTRSGSCTAPRWPLTAPRLRVGATSIRSQTSLTMARRQSTGRACQSSTVQDCPRASRSGCASLLTTRRRCSWPCSSSSSVLSVAVPLQTSLRKTQILSSRVSESSLSVPQAVKVGLPALRLFSNDYDELVCGD